MSEVIALKRFQRNLAYYSYNLALANFSFVSHDINSQVILFPCLFKSLPLFPQHTLFQHHLLHLGTPPPTHITLTHTLLGKDCRT